MSLLVVPATLPALLHGSFQRTGTGAPEPAVTAGSPASTLSAIPAAATVSSFNSTPWHELLVFGLRAGER